MVPSIPVNQNATLKLNLNTRKVGKKRHCSQSLEGEKKKVIESDDGSGSGSGSEYDDQVEQSTQGIGEWSVVERGKKKQKLKWIFEFIQSKSQRATAVKQNKVHHSN